MTQKLFWALGPIVVAISALAASPAGAQTTTAAGPYYATPSWDQTLPAATRFIVLSNFASAAVLDRETGLVWERSPNTARQNWIEAQARCFEKTVGNRKGWRLPAIQELASLVDGDPANTANPKLPPGHPFTIAPSTFFWSANILVDSTSSAVFAWGIFFFDGNAIQDFKSAIHPVWCVRGGQGGGPQ